MGDTYSVSCFCVELEFGKVKEGSGGGARDDRRLARLRGRLTLFPGHLRCTSEWFYWKVLMDGKQVVLFVGGE